MHTVCYCQSFSQKGDLQGPGTTSSSDLVESVMEMVGGFHDVMVMSRRYSELPLTLQTHQVVWLAVESVWSSTSGCYSSKQAVSGRGHQDPGFESKLWKDP